jgi:heptose I phosphotransferase
VICILDPQIKNAFADQSDLFDQIMNLQGKVFRELENRRTQRIELAGQFYFIKQHMGVGWKEIFKNLFQLRLPVISAKNEWQAIRQLQQLGIPTLDIVGYGVRGTNPAKQQSFLITKELPTFITLEDLCKTWKNQPPAFKLKQQLLLEIARIARTLHIHGINHRDFYLCHFLLDLIEYPKSVKLYLIDLHRAQIRKRTPERWVIKDLAGLYFSSKEMGLTRRDLLRFMKIYSDKSLRDILNKETTFWWKVKKRGDKLYRKHGKQ